jgi:predicted SnoaL-like aldol condensation-catalyzing enzyme
VTVDIIDLKPVARQFLALAAAGNARAGASKLVAPGFRHHNMHFAGDGAALFEAMDKNAAQFPGKRLDVVHALQDGDMVSTLCKVQHTPDEAGYAVAHVFRFENGKIAELWDLAQEIPKDSPNQYGPF